MTDYVMHAGIRGLKAQLGDARFIRFIYALRDGHSERLLCWQDEQLDRLDAGGGPRLPRSPRALRELLLPLLSQPKRLAKEAMPSWIRVESLGGSAPVQGSGTADGAPWYFRAKYGEWSLGLSKTEGLDAVSVIETGASTFYHEEEYGDGLHDANHMPTDEARFFIVSQLVKWKDEGVLDDGATWITVQR